MTKKGIFAVRMVTSPFDWVFMENNEGLELEIASYMSFQ